MPADPISFRQQQARFAQSSRPSPQRTRQHPARVRPARIINLTTPRLLEWQHGPTRLSGLRPTGSVAGMIAFGLLAQQASTSLTSASLIGAEFGHSPPPTPFDPGPVDPTSPQWAGPGPQAEAQGRSRVLATGGGWPPGAIASDLGGDVVMEMTPLQQQQPATADSQVMQAASNTVLALCVRNPGTCGTALAAGVAIGTLATLGSGVVRALDATTQRASAPNADDGGGFSPPSAGATSPSRPPPQRYRIDETALPPQVRFNASELDPQRSPCQSLGRHVNGRWQDGRALERSRTQQGTFVDLRDRSLVIRQQIARQCVQLTDPTPAEKVVADLWSSGMDAARIDSLGLAPLQPALDEIDALQRRDDLPAYLFDQTVLGRNPLFNLAALPDQQVPARNMAYLSQGGLGLPDAGWYANPAMSGRIAAYQQHVAGMLHLSGMTADVAAAAADRVVALETKLAEASEPFVRLAEDVGLYYNPLDLATASAVTPRLHWSALFDAHGIARPPQVSLGMPAYFEQLDELLATVPLQDWKDYLRFHATDRAAPCLAQRFAEAHATFHDGVLKGRRSQVPRWARVLDIIEHHAGHAMGEPYIEATYPPRADARMHAMTHQLRGALMQRLERSPWMQPRTIAVALQKAKRMKLDVGAPTKWPDWTGTGTQGKDFLQDVQAVAAFAHQRNIARVDQPVDVDEWKMSPQTVDAYQDAFQNRIVLPAAILQPPFFDPGADDALNYGGIGVVLGHEMAHGFDSIGSTVAADGTTTDWWTPIDRQRFEAFADRLAAQVKGYQVNGRDVDGELTLDENLADLGGLVIALHAMREATADQPDPMIDGMTREQRFFANFAFCWRRAATEERASLDMETDNHAPSQVRADLGPSNMPAFAEAFDCAPGDPMNRNASDHVRFL